jgi:hypothetical protein
MPEFGKVEIRPGNGVLEGQDQIERLMLNAYKLATAAIAASI